MKKKVKVSLKKVRKKKSEKKYSRDLDEIGSAILGEGGLEDEPVDVFDCWCCCVGDCCCCCCVCCDIGVGD